jgi:glycerol-3-phosphate acyltransferase PlsY
LLDILLGSSAVIIGYLLGSIPTAYILGKLSKGVDIRKVDTGNVGTASTFRAIGTWQGFVVGAVDIGKGSAAIGVAYAMGVSLYWMIGAGFAAYLGHCFPVFIGFRGGQGAATLIGIFAALTFWAALASCCIIVFTMYLNRRIVLQRVFFSILVGGPTLPIFIWIFYQSWELVVFSIIIILFVIWRNWPTVKAPLRQDRYERKT